ncbi:hypothetical protein TNCV_2850181 [Trichonephila clavipes]|nr:hypothetical protein TNCV_2850181 [Trichonephila clavipes]
MMSPTKEELDAVIRDSTIWLGTTPILRESGAIVISDAAAVPLGLGSNPGERYGCLLMCSAFAAWGYSYSSSPEVCGRGREIEGSDHSQVVLPQKWGGTKPNRTVICMVLKVMAKYRRATSPLP